MKSTRQCPVAVPVLPLEIRAVHVCHLVCMDEPKSRLRGSEGGYVSTQVATCLAQEIMQPQRMAKGIRQDEH